MRRATMPTPRPLWAKLPPSPIMLVISRFRTTPQSRLNSECGALFKALADEGKPAASFAVSRFEDIWDAVRHFFQHQAAGPP